jgi:hypothetical protein
MHLKKWATLNERFECHFMLAERVKKQPAVALNA